MLASLTGSVKSDVILMLVLGAMVNLLLAVIVCFRSISLTKDVERLSSVRRKLARAAEIRLFKELHTRSTPRLLLEGPKPFARDNLIGPISGNSGTTSGRIGEP